MRSRTLGGLWRQLHSSRIRNISSAFKHTALDTYNKGNIRNQETLLSYCFLLNPAPCIQHVIHLIAYNVLIKIILTTKYLSQSSSFISVCLNRRRDIINNFCVILARNRLRACHWSVIDLIISNEATNTGILKP